METWRSGNLEKVKIGTGNLEGGNLKGENLECGNLEGGKSGWWETWVRFMSSSSSSCSSSFTFQSSEFSSSFISNGLAQVV